jgi:arginyl-tRNA synthetase
MQSIHDILQDAIQSELAALGVAEGEFVVEHPTELSHGDYATNAALVAAKVVGMNPRELAETLVEKLRNAAIPGVAAVECAGPGFINFHLTREHFTSVLEEVSAQGGEWGKGDMYAGQTVLVEYTDPNPFKEFHIGHLFTNAVGEAVSRLFVMGGADVKRVNYQGDIGLHVACAVWGMRALNLDTEFSAAELGKAYAHGATTYKSDETAADEIRAINRALYERSDEALNALYDKGRAVSLAYFETIYGIVGTHFDHYFFESEAGPRGKELVLSAPETFPESDGARVFKGEEYGLHTRVFLNREGLPTYEAKELALAKMKEEVFQYDHSVISTANEITEYFKVLLKAMSFVYPELAAKTEHIGHGTVRLTSGKMSSRTGDVIPALDFIHEIRDAAREKMRESGRDTEDEELSTQVAVGAIKYATLRGNILADSVFDKTQALSFEGDSGPYLQYTYARICSIREKAEREGVISSVAQPTPSTAVVERLIPRFPEVVARALKERAPHHVATYLIELSGAFNTWYAAETIVAADDELSPYRVALAGAVGQTIKNGLWVLGIEAPERM